MTRAERIEEAAKVVAWMADSRHPWAAAGEWWKAICDLRDALSAPAAPKEAP